MLQLASRGVAPYQRRIQDAPDKTFLSDSCPLRKRKWAVW